MRQFFMFLWVLLNVVYSFGQSCLPNGISFTTQEQIDSFAINYPGCTEVLGDVVIDGDFQDLITNLDGINSLSIIRGNFQLEKTRELYNLAGLDSLAIVEGILKIELNLQLNDISALANVNPDFISELYISANPDLSICDYPFICDYMENGGILEIKGNEWNCEQNRIYRECGIPAICPPYNMMFESQEDVDIFPVLYPECTALSAGLGIKEFPINVTPITDLSPLSQLTAIESYLWITSNNSLINLNGLHNLTHIGGNLTIQYNQQLESLQGLQNLSHIGGELKIIAQDSIPNYSGLENLQILGGGLRIYDNDKLTDITALSNLTSAIDGRLSVTGNNRLFSLEGLHNIDLSNVTNLIVHNNYLLSGCHFENICQYIENGGQTFIFDNSPPCKNVQTILENCLVPTNTPNLYPDLAILPNPNTGTFQVENIPRGTYNLLNTKGQLIQSGQLEDGTLIDISHTAQGVYFIQMIIDEQIVTRRIVKL